MNTPRNLLSRARHQRRPGIPHSPAPRQPAPQPLNPLAAEPEPPAAGAGGECRPAPQPAGGHALYRALMRSHDRMGTRHLNGPG